MADSDREREARQQIAETEEAEARDRASGAASLFDLRTVIGGLLALYGAILTVMGLFASAGTKAKAAGININLWAGLAMLLVGAAFIAWVVLRPLKTEEVADDAEDERPASVRQSRG